MRQMARLASPGPLLLQLLCGLIALLAVLPAADAQASPSGVNIADLSDDAAYGLYRSRILLQTGWHDGTFPTCYDQTQNGDETGVDTGGSCPATSCSDSTQNGDETGADCGGSCSACSG